MESTNASFPTPTSVPLFEAFLTPPVLQLVAGSHNRWPNCHFRGLMRAGRSLADPAFSAIWAWSSTSLDDR